MNSAPALAWLKQPKHILIILLSVAVLVESILLAAAPSPEPKPVEGDKTAIEVADLTLDMDRMRDLYLEFNYPLGKDLVGQEANATLGAFSPDMVGAWTWISPTMLNFKAEEPFARASQYELALNPPTILGADETFVGETLLTFKTGTFNVERIELSQEPAHTGPAMVSITGQIRFNTSVSPESLVNSLTLIDPLRGEDQPVPVAVIDSWSDRTLNFRSEPVEKTSQPRDLVLVVSPDLKPSVGNIPLGQEATQAINLFLDPVLHAREADYVSQGDHFNIRIELSSPVDPDAAKDFLRVTPETPVRLSAQGTRLTLHGDFLPGQNYAVRLEPGLTAVDGARLEEEWSVGGTMPDLDPRVGFAAKGMFLSAKDSRQMVLESVNTPRAELIVDRVYYSNIFNLFAHEGWQVFEPDFWGNNLSHALGDRLLSTTVALEHKRNQITRSSVDLGTVIDENKPGFYRVGVTQDGDYWGAQRWVMVTDIGLVTKKGVDSIMVWAVSLKTLAPLPGVSLSLISDQNQVMAAGATDGQGLWRVKNLDKSFDQDTPYLVLARKGGDMSFVLLDRFRADTAGLDIAGQTAPSGYLAFLYGERDIYRPGEEVHGVAVLRDAGLGVPPTMPVTLTRTDPQGRVLDSRNLTTDSQGTVEFSLDVPADALTGHYRLELAVGDEVVGRYRYQVEEFIPDRIGVDIETAKAALSPGDNLAFTVASRYLFGPPASDLPVEARVKLEPAAFQPAGYADHIFGDPDRDFPSTEIFSSDSGDAKIVLDAEGRLDFSVALPTGMTPPNALRAQITARVSEQGGRGVTASQGVLVHPYPYYLGLQKPERNGVDPGQEQTFSFVALDPDGKGAAHDKLKATLYKDRWQTVLTQTPDGGMRYTSERDPEIIQVRDIAAGEKEGSFAFTPDDYGAYRVVLEDPATGAAASVGFYAGGWGYSPWALENPARIELIPDKDSYQPGETATFQVRAPFAGKLLVTVEGQNVLETKVIDLAGNTGQVSLAAKASYAPNVYVTAVLVRKASDLVAGEPGRALGAVAFNVGLDRGVAPVAVSAPAEMRPEQGLDIEVRTKPGSRVTVAAVDEGILQLIGQKTPNPFDYFYAKRGLEVETADVFSLLFPEAAALLNQAAGGGAELEAMSQFVRTESLTRVKPVAFFSGLLTADAEGKAVFHVDVPEFTGALRIMAVSMMGNAFGAGQATTRVKSPLTVLPTLPRFLAPDETLLVPVTVRNDTEVPAMLTVRLSVEGPAVVDEPEQSMQMDPGRSTTLYFPMETGSGEGKVVVTATVTGTIEGADESARSTTDLYLRSAMPFERQVHAGALMEAETELPGVGEALVPETVSRKLVVGPVLLARFSGNLASLLGYPYGCVEQTTSKAFPLLYFGDLAAELDPDLAEASTEASVQRAISRLATMQLDNGAFAMWPGGWDPQSYASVYATHFLTEASRAGFLVPEAMLGPALDYLAQIAADSGYYDSNPELATYAMYVLALAGRAEMGGMSWLASNGQLDGESRVLLAAAFGAVGNVPMMNKLLSKPIEVAEIQRELSGNLGSTTRNLALTLLALCQAAPDDGRIPDLAQRLTERLTTGWYTTQENAFGLMALGWFSKRLGEAPPYTGEVYVGDAKMGDFSNEKTLALDIDGLEPVRLVLSEGFKPGTAFYSMRVNGSPVPAAYTPLADGLELTRTFLDRNGDALDLSKVAQGDLVVMKTDIVSKVGPVDNLAVQLLLPTGLEVENPRLSNTEILEWMGGTPLVAAYQDLRDDRVLIFADLPSDGSSQAYTVYSLLRAVVPGSFTLPPARAEAMYDPAIQASGEVGTITVNRTEAAPAPDKEKKPDQAEGDSGQ